MVFDPGTQPARNSLHRLASAGGVMLGVFLLAGASGHFVAVWPAFKDAMIASDNSRVAPLLPGLILAATGLTNIGLCKALWSGTRWSLQLALLFNGGTAMYLAYLLSLGVPGHPIGVFLALVSSYFVVLGAIRVGLVWPAVDSG